MSKESSHTEAAQKAFLSALAAGHSVAGACRAASLARSYAYRMRTANQDFAIAWDEAMDAQGNYFMDLIREAAAAPAGTPGQVQAAMAGARVHGHLVDPPGRGVRVRKAGREVVSPRSMREFSAEQMRIMEAWYSRQKGT